MREGGRDSAGAAHSVSESGEKGLGEMRAPGLSIGLCLEQLLCVLEKAVGAHV